MGRVEALEVYTTRTKIICSRCREAQHSKLIEMMSAVGLTTLEVGELLSEQKYLACSACVHGMFANTSKETLVDSTYQSVDCLPAMPRKCHPNAVAMSDDGLLLQDDTSDDDSDSGLSGILD